MPQHGNIHAKVQEALLPTPVPEWPEMGLQTAVVDDVIKSLSPTSGWCFSQGTIDPMLLSSQWVGAHRVKWGPTKVFSIGPRGELLVRYNFSKLALMCGWYIDCCEPKRLCHFVRLQCHCNVIPLLHDAEMLQPKPLIAGTRSGHSNSVSQYKC